MTTRMMVELIYAPLYYRVLFATDPARPQDITLLVDYTLSGLRPEPAE